METNAFRCNKFCEIPEIRNMRIALPNKLPQVGHSIFTVMSQKASELSALNMGQGFPEFSPPEELMKAVHSSMEAGFNQYPPMPGYMDLREIIAQREQQIHGNSLNPESEITVVPGATAGIFTVFQALIQAGDEVIIIEPAYDSYRPAIELAGGKVVGVSINFQSNIENPELFESSEVVFPWQKLKESINEKTRWIVINTPHNPLGFTFKETDWTQLWEIIQNYSIGIISDEVYEHMVFDGKKHVSVLNMPELRERSVKISSFGKTFHCTGWKMGYIAANAEITQSIRMVFQYLAFATNSAMQKGITQFMQLNPNWETELNLFYQKKRDLFLRELHGCDSINSTKPSWKTLNCEGSYFQVLKYNTQDIPKLGEIKSDLDMAMWLIRSAGIATIPIDSFIQGQPQTGCLRICFAKNEDTIIKAAKLLNQVL